MRQVGVLAPVRLQEDAVDLLQVDGFGAIAHGLEQGTEAEVSRAAQDSLARAYDEAGGVVGEGRVCERDPVELGSDAFGDTVWIQFLGS